MIPAVYDSFFPDCVRYYVRVGDEIITTTFFGNVRLFGVPSREKDYVYLRGGIEVEFRYTVLLESCAPHLWLLNGNTTSPQSRRAQVVFGNEVAGFREHHWGLKFKGDNRLILFHALLEGQRARVIDVPAGYGNEPKKR